jgi:hypothetical protein
MRLLRRRQAAPDPDKQMLEQRAREVAEQRQANERRLRILEGNAQVMRRQ